MLVVPLIQVFEIIHFEVTINTINLTNHLTDEHGFIIENQLVQGQPKYPIMYTKMALNINTIKHFVVENTNKMKDRLNLFLTYSSSMSPVKVILGSYTFLSLRPIF